MPFNNALLSLPYHFATDLSTSIHISATSPIVTPRENVPLTFKQFLQQFFIPALHGEMQRRTSALLIFYGKIRLKVFILVNF
jgi:hypothetical protein